MDDESIRLFQCVTSIEHDEYGPGHQRQHKRYGMQQKKWTRADDKIIEHTIFFVDMSWRHSHGISSTSTSVLAILSRLLGIPGMRRAKLLRTRDNRRNEEDDDGKQSHDNTGSCPEF